MNFIDETSYEKMKDYGFGFYTEAELIGILLGLKEEAAESVADFFDSVDTNEILRNIEKTAKNEKTRMKLLALFQLKSRYTAVKKAVIKSPRDLIPYINHIALDSIENMLLIMLDGSYNIIGIECIAKGSCNACQFKIKDIAWKIAKNKVSAFMLAHNHPNGSLAPSDSDIKTTERMNEMGNLIGVKMLDHIIVTQSGYFSFVEHDMLKND